MIREAMKLALEALEGSIALTMPKIALRKEAIAALREALAQPQQEPVANRKEFEQWCKHSGHDYCFSLNKIGEYQWADAQGAYEAYWARNTLSQPARKPLTDEQIYMHCPNWLSQEQCKAWVRRIEAAHGIKEAP